MSGDQTLEHSCAHSIIHSIPLSFNCKQKPFHQLTLSSPSNSSQGHQKHPWTRGFMWIFWDWGSLGSFHSHINFWLCSSIWNGNKMIFTPVLQIYLGLCTGPSSPCSLTSQLEDSEEGDLLKSVLMVLLCLTKCYWGSQQTTTLIYGSRQKVKPSRRKHFPHQRIFKHWKNKQHPKIAKFSFAHDFVFKTIKWWVGASQ